MISAELRIVRFALAAVWLTTGFIVLVVYPIKNSLALLEQAGLVGSYAVAALYGGALIDVALGVLTLIMRNKWLWVVQACLTVIYTLIITFRLPEFWTHPFGPVLKNLPILALLWLLYKNEKRTA
jgi:hypothetical protein